MAVSTKNAVLKNRSELLFTQKQAWFVSMLLQYKNNGPRPAWSGS